MKTGGEVLTDPQQKWPPTSSKNFDFPSSSGIFYHPSPKAYYPHPTPPLPPSTGGKTHDNMNLLRKLIIQDNYQKEKK